MTTPSDSAIARVDLPSVVVTRGDRLWSVFEQRWVGMNDLGSIDVNRTVILLPPHAARRQRARRRLARRAIERRRQAAFVVVQAVLGALTGFILGTWMVL